MKNTLELEGKTITLIKQASRYFNMSYNELISQSVEKMFDDACLKRVCSNATLMKLFLDIRGAVISERKALAQLKKLY